MRDRLETVHGKPRVLVHEDSPTPYLRRPRAHGKFIFAGEEKFLVRGVTYGTFRPREDGTDYPEAGIVERDFTMMAATGINAVRTYTVPPKRILDAAMHHGMRVMVGLPWEQHITFLDDRKRVKTIEERVRQGIRACRNHPAILCYSIGNEIPPSIVRWHGKERIERFLERLYDIAKSQDPQGLVTYVNFPTTEYLELSFLDIVCFNVFLESKEPYEAYVARLQNLAADRPLIMTEIGLDSRRHGEEEQARSIDWQVRSSYAGGGAGTFVFSWTDEWHRGGYDIEDWDFGLTTRDRQRKPALDAVRKAYAEVPFPPDIDWPKVSVVVCSFNGARTIRETLEGLGRLNYPDYEVIVVNDGSTDDTPRIAAEYDVRLISTENRGLSSARNSGWQESAGEIVAYIDDDANPDPDWLRYLAHTFLTTSHAGVGGPNIAPPANGLIADCIANAPGGPAHVLVSDREAEHIPGCNMAFRRDVLEAVGGFDPRYRAAGDDVDLCWRLLGQGGTIGFNPAAAVWHHRRNSIKAYWNQQKGYGKAEALLEEKWPEKYNALGHLKWAGRLYGNGLTRSLRDGRGKVYHGVWGGALFQSIYKPAAGTLSSLPLMPEWYLVITLLALFSLLGIFWKPLLLAYPLLIIALVVPMVQAVLSARSATFPGPTRSFFEEAGMRAVTAFLHLAQPLARLIGRLRHGLTPWRSRGDFRLSLPRTRKYEIWSETWRSAEEWLGTVESKLLDEKAPFRRGGEFDRWDLEVRGGMFGSARLVMAIEEHGGGKQYVRFRVWPRFSLLIIFTILIPAILLVWSASESALIVSLLFTSFLVLATIRMLKEFAQGREIINRCLEKVEREKPENG